MPKYRGNHGRDWQHPYQSAVVANRANFLLAMNDKPVGVHQRIISVDQNQRLREAAEARGYEYEVLALEGQMYFPIVGGFSIVQAGDMYVRISGFGREGLAELWREVGIY